jgi:hypothetical protein
MEIIYEKLFHKFHQLIEPVKNKCQSSLIFTQKYYDFIYAQSSQEKIKRNELMHFLKFQED